MPSMFALGHPLTGNPDLDPEQSTSYSATVEKYFPEQEASISLTLFKNEFKNLVDFDVNTFLHVNRARAQSKGVELSGKADLTLFDKDMQTVFVVAGNYSAALNTQPRIDLSTEAGAATAGSSHDLSADLGHWVVDAATFATGLIRVELHGKLGVRIDSIASGLGAVRMFSDLLDDALRLSSWEDEIPDDAIGDSLP